MFSIVFFVSSTQFHKNSQFNEEPIAPTRLISPTEYLLHYLLEMWTDHIFRITK